MKASRGRILVVEDHDATRQSLASVLRHAGHLVMSVATGSEATRILSAGRHAACDVVLSDLLLHDLTGIDILRVTRSLESPPEFILLTGCATLDSTIEALRLGALDYILKPTDPELLLERLQVGIARKRRRDQQQQALDMIASSLALLESGTQASSACGGAPPHRATGRYLTIGRLTIDQEARVVTFDGQPVTLTFTEYEIIARLARSPARLVSYQTLVSHVYHQDLSQSGAHQLLKTHVHNLRQKIDHAYIINVRGSGYKLAALAHE
jgi:two-component system, OmpR family, response regulator